jgi:hypothetical protein
MRAYVKNEARGVPNINYAGRILVNSKQIKNVEVRHKLPLC